MKKSVWLLGLLPLLLGLAGDAQEEKLTLQFGPAAGTTLVYAINGQVGVAGKDLLGKDLTLNAASVGEIRLAVRAAGRDKILAGLTSPGIDVQIQYADKTESQTLKTEGGKALEVEFNRTGKVTNVTGADSLTQGTVLNFSIPQIVRDYFPAFPAQPVAQGDQWVERRKLTIPFQGFELQAELTARYTLDSVFPSPEGRKAVVSAAYTVTVSGAKDLNGSTGAFEGSGAGSGFLNLLVDRGYFTEYRIDFKTQAAFVMKQGTKRLLEMPFTFSVVADVNLLEGGTQ